MPVLPMNGAKSCKANRLDMYPEDQVQGSAPIDDSLTSLDWLQNFSINFSLIADPERPSGPGCPSPQEQLILRRLGTDSPYSPAVGDKATTGMPQYLGSPVTSSSDSTVGPVFSRYPCIPMQPIPLVEVDYKTNPKLKPPHSYASLICMAMKASKQPKVTLSTIYEWITENFCYYRHAEHSWQNTIRHTLCLNKCFRKVPRQKDEPGRGGFWQINPEHLDMFANGIFKRRRLPANPYSTQSRNKPFQGYQGNASASVNQSVSTDNRRTTRFTETPLFACRPDSLRGAAAAGDSELNTAVSTLECEMEGMQQPTREPARWEGGGGGDMMNHQLSYGYMDLCATTMDGTGNIATFQMPLQYLYHHQDQQHLVHLDESSVLFSDQSGVGRVQPWAEVEVATESVASGSRLWSE